MGSNTLDQIGVAVKIWLVAVGISALLGVLFMTFQHGIDTAAIFAYGFLLIIDGIFSLPVLMVIMIVIWILSGNVSGNVLFACVLASGVITTILMFRLIWPGLGEGDKIELFFFPTIGIVSGITAVTAFYRSLVEYGKDFTTDAKP